MPMNNKYTKYTNTYTNLSDNEYVLLYNLNYRNFYTFFNKRYTSRSYVQQASYVSMLKV